MHSRFKKLLTISFAIVLAAAFCFDFGSLISEVQAEGESGSSRDVTPPDVYVTEDQLHARLFTYDGADFTNISGEFQNVSPEVQSIGWNDTNWLVSARGRFWEYNGAVLTNVAAIETADFYPYYDVAWNGAYWLGGSLMGGVVEYDGSIADAYPLDPSRGADVLTTDWNETSQRWILGVFGQDFNVDLISYPGVGGINADLSLPPGINGGFAGDYRANNDNTYYLAGGAQVTMDEVGNITDSHSQLFSYNGAAFVDQQQALIPDMKIRVTAITGGTDSWLVGGEGTKPLYQIDEDGGDFSGTAIDTPAELTSIKSIGWAADNNWLIGGYYTNETGTSAKLYSYNGTDFTDLTSTMLSSVESYISDINSIVWNEEDGYWLIGGAGLYNVGSDNGGSVMSTDESAKVAFTGGAVDHDSSVSVTNEGAAIIPTEQATAIKSLGETYEFTCQDLVDNVLVTQFDKSASLSLSYDPTELGDMAEISLAINYYDTNLSKWVAVSSTVDTTNHLITAEVNHFTQFGLFSSLPETGMN